MKDIKSLYLTAKSSGKQTDIINYTEAIQDLIDNNPFGYITHLEYIISSDIGLNTVKPFIEKNGFPISCYDNMIESLNECIRKCEVYGKDHSPYTEMKQYFEKFRSDHINCFMMFENYSLDINKNYVNIYYGKNSKGIQNRKLISGMIKTFGEAAIPDALITAESINEDAVHTVLEFINNEFSNNDNSATIYEWVLTACENINYSEKSELIIDQMTENSLSAIVDRVRFKEHQVYRESVIMDRDDLVVEYTETDINAIQELIMFKEYQMLWIEESEGDSKDDKSDSEKYGFKRYTPDEAYQIWKDKEDKKPLNKLRKKLNLNNHIGKIDNKVNQKIDKIKNVAKDIDNKFIDSYEKLLLANESSLFKLQNEIYSLYEMIDFLEENNTEELTEAMWLRNTRNKKTGEIPGYLANNHDMYYDDEKPSKPNSEPTLDDYRRPSISNNDNIDSMSDNTPSPSYKDAEPLKLPSAFNDNKEDNKPNISPSTNIGLSDHDKKIINNYYYQNYTNAFNKDYSVKNDHSKKDYSKHDDHSSVTHINSHNKDNNYGNTDDENNVKNESSKPWELNIFGSTNQVFEEGIRDFFKKAVNKVRGFIGVKKSLANLQNMGTPANTTKKIPMTIIGTNIPLEPNTSKLESYNNEIITEDADTFLSKNDVKNVINKLRSKFNADILFINSNSNPEILATVGPAACVRTDRDTINKLISGKTIDRIKSDLYGDTGNFETVILVNSKIMRDYNIKTPQALELIISHEYGHVLTYDQISLNEWYEYNVKRQILASLVGPIYDYDNKAMCETNFAYYKLKPEKLANEAVGINPSDLVSNIFGYTPTGKLDKIDIDVIINWNVPSVIMKMTDLSSKGITGFSNSDLVENMKFTMDLYKKCIKDKEFLNNVINMMEDQIKYYSSNLSESTVFEAVGDADDMKPKSDNPIKDILTDIDRKTTVKQQEAKKKVQKIQNTGRAVMKPINRTKNWIDKMVFDWKDKNENELKEKMTDPHARRNLYTVIRKCIIAGSLVKAGILLNPLFLVLAGSKIFKSNKEKFRIRNEIIGELKTEIEILDKKIEDARLAGDYATSYKFMRFKNELNKKLIRVGGSRATKKLI